MKAEHGTLVAATVTTVTLEEANSDLVVVHMTAGSGPVYFTVDGATPTVGGADEYVLHLGLPARSVDIPLSATQTVKLISATADGYAVEAVARVD